METAIPETETQPTQSCSRPTPDEIAALPEFQILSDKQQALVRTYFATGSKSEAVRAGYGNDMTAEQVRIGSYVYFASPRVMRCLDRVLGLKPQQPAELSQEMQELIATQVRDEIRERLGDLLQPTNSSERRGAK
jgi:hypothetical protein